MSVRHVPLWRTGDEKIPASIIVGAGSRRSRLLIPSGLLKKVPVWGGKRRRWLDGFRHLCNRPTSLACLGFLREAGPTPMASVQSRPGGRSYKSPADSFAMPVTEKEHRPRSSPDFPNRSETGTHFSIPSRSVQAGSRQPRSDNDRSRNLFVTRAPKPNTLYGQEDPQSKPDA